MGGGDCATVRVRSISQRFERGNPIGSLVSSPATQAERTGTSVRFKPDIEIFSTGIDFDYQTLAGRLRELAYLNGGVKIVFRDERISALGAMVNLTKRSITMRGASRSTSSYMNADKDALHPEIIYVNKSKDGVQVEAAMQWCRMPIPIAFSALPTTSARSMAAPILKGSRQC
jgi:DNA gyrase subunit B